jgi:hypothetical protein
VEQASDSSEKSAIPETRNAKYDAVANQRSVDPGLRQVIAAWGTLPHALWRAVLAIVESQS